MSKSKALAPAHISEMLKKAERKGVVADILAEVDEAAAIEKRGNNAATRQAAIVKALADNNELAEAEIIEAHNDHVDLAPQVAAFAPEAAETGLSDEQALTAMRLLLAGKVISESERALYEVVRNLVFRSMDIAFGDDEFPEAVNGYIDVPELGKRFCREGAGRKEATFDMDALRELLGDELFDQVTIKKVEYKVDETALAKLGISKPGLLEQLRDVVKPGDWKSPRLMIRDIPADEKE